MTIQEPPQILRIKRKRTDDPLQALLFETRQVKKSRRSKPKYVFKLQRTEEKDSNDSTTILASSNSNKDNKPVFNLPNPTKLGTGTNTELSDSTSKPKELKPELLEMLNDYLKENDTTVDSNPVKPTKRRMSSISQDSSTSRPQLSLPQYPPMESAIDDETQDGEYVYDVYYRDKAVSDQWENDKIGYIKYDDDDLEQIDEQDDQTVMNTDDEDSNDEDFYRNDYPDDEDGGYDESDLESLGLEEPSDDQDDEFDILNDKKRFTKDDFMQSEGLKSMSDSEYEHLADQIDEKPNAWDRKQLDGDGDEDMSVDDDSEIQRHEFFKSDKEDPIAMHRDRIFGKLQNMIDKKN